MKTLEDYIMPLIPDGNICGEKNGTCLFLRYYIWENGQYFCNIFSHNKQLKKKTKYVVYKCNECIEFRNPERK